MRIEWTGLTHAASSGTYINVDAMDGSIALALAIAGSSIDDMGRR